MTKVRYSGQVTEDEGFFFAPYWPGMTDEDRARIDAEIAERSGQPTELQKQIMRTVRNEN